MVNKFILKYFIFFNLFLVVSGKDDQELALDYFMQGQFLLNQGTCPPHEPRGDGFSGCDLGRYAQEMMAAIRTDK